MVVAGINGVNLQSQFTRQHVEHETILIDSLQKPVSISTDHNFIEVPFVAEPAGGSPADFV